MFTVPVLPLVSEGLEFGRSVCMRERERECVCVCVRERERL